MVLPTVNETRKKKTKCKFKREMFPIGKFFLIFNSQAYLSKLRGEHQKIHSIEMDGEKLKIEGEEINLKPSTFS